MKVNLCKDWYVKYEELNCEKERAGDILASTEGWMACDVPCDIRQPLIANGIIKEPLEGMNCFDSEWVENKSWWFKKTFIAEKNLLGEDVVELVLESVDYGADIFLNGLHIGFQLSSFYAFRKNVKKHLSPGKNVILIRLTTGLERVNPSDLEPYTVGIDGKRSPSRGDTRRAFLRKPQYSFGWDWAPRVSTCGIMKEVWLESYRKVAIHHVKAYVKSLEPETILSVMAEIENYNSISSMDVKMIVRIQLDGGAIAFVERDIPLRSGINYLDTEIKIPDARLWWPNGMGSQPLYKIEVSIHTENIETAYPSFYYGIRTIEIDQTRLNKEERLFAIKINGVQIFCKGGNWIPADSLYGRVSDEKYCQLVQEAAEANFNMLRLWGGGLYEKDAFYNLCDKHGILIWHDFMFACSQYPDDHEWYYKEVENELEYQTRKLSNHPSIALWCGNNEIHWGYDEWWEDKENYGSRIFNFAAPSAVKRNCSDIPYWSSSPYGGIHPNGTEQGDEHHWNDCMMNEDMQKRVVPEEFDKVTGKFVSEYGYVGPLKRSSIEKCLPGEEFDINGEVWQHHNNSFEKDTVLAGIKYHYKDPENMDIDSYLLYAGLCQGLMYSYSLEALRCKPECFGGLFWMYNDCWGETGWTIIDYYLNRKISYYFVKRALAPVKLILREKDGVIHSVGINEKETGIDLNVEYGYIFFDGTQNDIHTTILHLQPYSRELVLNFKKGKYDERKGVYFVKVIGDSDIPTTFLRTHVYRELHTPAAKVSILSFTRTGSDVIVTVKSEYFAHAVHFNLPDEIHLSDDYFDLLPGQSRTITIKDMPLDFTSDMLRVSAVNAL